MPDSGGGNIRKGVFLLKARGTVDFYGLSLETDPRLLAAGNFKQLRIRKIKRQLRCRFVNGTIRIRDFLL